MSDDNDGGGKPHPSMQALAALLLTMFCIFIGGFIASFIYYF